MPIKQLHAFLISVMSSNLILNRKSIFIWLVKMRTYVRCKMIMRGVHAEPANGPSACPVEFDAKYKRPKPEL